MKLRSTAPADLVRNGFSALDESDKIVHFQRQNMQLSAGYLPEMIQIIPGMIQIAEERRVSLA